MTRILALLLALTGCNLVFKAQTHGPGGGTPASAVEPAAAPSRGKHAITTTGVAIAPAATGRMAGVHTDEINDTLVARMMSWATACFADYDDLRARWAPYETKYAARFAELQKLDNYYALRDALAAFAKDYYADIKAAGLDVQGMTWRYLVGGGLAYRVDAYVAELDRKRGITRAVKVFQPQYPPAADDTVAADAYCIGAQMDGTHRTRAWSGLGFDDMLPADRARNAGAYLAARAKTIDADLAAAPARPEHYTALDVSTYLAHNMEFTTGAMFQLGAQVASIKPGKHGVTIKATQQGTMVSQHDCVETKRVDSIDASGRVRYRERCKLDSSTNTITFELAFPDAPAELRKGDWIDFDAVLTKASHGKLDKATGTPTSYRFELDGVLVHQVARAKHPGDRPDQFAILAAY